MSANKIFQDCVVLIKSVQILNAKSAIKNRLERHGARIATKLSSQVTHVVFERRRSQRALDKKNDEDSVSELYKKIESVSLLYITYI